MCILQILSLPASHFRSVVTEHPSPASEGKKMWGFCMWEEALAMWILSRFARGESGTSGGKLASLSTLPLHISEFILKSGTSRVKHICILFVGGIKGVWLHLGQERHDIVVCNSAEWFFVAFRLQSFASTIFCVISMQSLSPCNVIVVRLQVQISHACRPSSWCDCGYSNLHHCRQHCTRASSNF